MRVTSGRLAWPDVSTEERQDVQEDRGGIGLGHRVNGPHDVASETVERHRVKLAPEDNL